MVVENDRGIELWPALRAYEPVKSLNVLQKWRAEDRFAKDSPFRYDLMEVRAVLKLNLPVQHLDSRKKQFEYKEGVQIPSY